MYHKEPKNNYLVMLTLTVESANPKATIDESSVISTLHTEEAEFIIV